MSDGEMKLENIVCPQFYLTSPYIGFSLILTGHQEAHFLAPWL
jgi:hypothetical protein